MVQQLPTKSNKLNETYLSYKKFTTLNFKASLYFQKNKIKLRLFNTNEPFASIPALLQASYKREVINHTNITKSRTDYIDGKVTSNRKIDLIINPLKETKEDYIDLLNLAKNLIAPDKYKQLLTFAEGL